MSLSAIESHKNLPNYLPSEAWAKDPVSYGKVRVKLVGVMDGGSYSLSFDG